jgi:Lipase maturation factor
MAILLAFAAVSDPVAHAVLPVIPLEWHAADAGAAGATAGSQAPVPWLVVVLFATVLHVVLSYRPVENLLSRQQLMNASFNRWQLVNTYGAFGTVTKQRIEIVVEGTLSAEPEDADWKEYEFKGKPGNVRRLPRQYAPYHLRLDWLMWFLPLRTVHEEWFYAFLAKLLEADRQMLRLLRHDPFDGARPRWVRVRSYLYRFATRAEFRATGQRWIRMSLAVSIPPIALPPQE